MFFFKKKIHIKRDISAVLADYIKFCLAQGCPTLTQHLRKRRAVLKHSSEEGENPYRWGENGVRQREPLQVSHQAVGQEGVDGRDLRGGSRLDCGAKIITLRVEFSCGRIQRTEEQINLSYWFQRTESRFGAFVELIKDPSSPIPLKSVQPLFLVLRLNLEQAAPRDEKPLTVIQVQQRHFFFLFLALLLDGLWWRFGFSSLQGIKRKPRGRVKTLPSPMTGQFGSYLDDCNINSRSPLHIVVISDYFHVHSSTVQCRTGRLHVSRGGSSVPSSSF